MQPLQISGAWLSVLTVHTDHRGSFHEWFQLPAFTSAVGHPFPLAQANCSVSAQGTLRGIHFADVPPGQAKYVTCVRGAVLDVVVDVRVGSPTYARWEAVRLDAACPRSLYLAESLGHAFLALTDDATVVYLCSEGYAPQSEHGIHPLDPELAIDWPAGVDLRLSLRDAHAPTLAEARRACLLPHYRDPAGPELWPTE